jgi:formylglycine-generating enzyme required for sulfatase activity
MSKAGAMKRAAIFGAIAVGLLVLIGWFAVAAISGGRSAPGTPTLTPDPEDVLQATQTYQSNTAWTPVIEEFDGVEMVLVPAGCFQMGSTDEQIEALIQACESKWGAENCERSLDEDEGPQHLVCFSAPYWLDRYEVSQGQFEQFGGQAAAAPEFPGNILPRENIRWREAHDHCEQRGARLPTEAEWEYTARGPDGRVYPWGNMFECNRGNFDDETKEDSGVIEGGAGCDGFDTTSPVGSFPAGASWVGALDMSGNVSEWVSSIYQPYPYSGTDGRESNSDTSSARVFRGGSWLFPKASIFRAADRGFAYPGSISDGFLDLGFRCARSTEG